MSTTTRNPRSGARRGRIALTLSLVAVSGLLLAGCSAAAATTTTSGSTEQNSASGSGGQPGGGGVSGEIASVSDTLLQVQSTDEQTAVSYDATTTIQATVAASLADVTVGSCVVVMGGTDADAATSVAISQPVDGACASAFGGGMGGGGMSGAPGGAGDGTAPTDRPSDAPTDMPSGAPTDGTAPAGGQGGFGGLTRGQVTAVDGSTITVAAVSMAAPGDSSSDSTDSTDSGTTATPTTAPTDVTVGDATTYTTTVAGSAADLVVGVCVSAQGQSNESGGFAATSLTVSAATDAGCSTGFGGGRPQGTDNGTSNNG